MRRRHQKKATTDEKLPLDLGATRADQYTDQQRSDGMTVLSAAPLLAPGSCLLIGELPVEIPAVVPGRDEGGGRGEGRHSPGEEQEDQRAGDGAHVGR